MHALLLALAILPRLDAAAEVTHDLGSNDALRGSIELRLDLDAVAGDGWRFSIRTAVRSFVRDNRADESPVRISPEQIHYPVGGHLRFRLDGPAELGVFVAHQSNHDVDQNDPQLNHETLSFELYGLEYLRPALRLHAALIYDRGTRLSGEAQTLPLEYGLAVGGAEGEVSLFSDAYAAGALGLMVHRAGSGSPSWLDTDLALELGWRLPGAAGDWRLFSRFWRLERYQYLEDEPEHLLLAGLRVGRGPWGLF